MTSDYLSHDSTDWLERSVEGPEVMCYERGVGVRKQNSRIGQFLIPKCSLSSHRISMHIFSSLIKSFKAHTHTHTAVNTSYATMKGYTL